LHQPAERYAITGTNNPTFPRSAGGGLKTFSALALNFGDTRLSNQTEPLCSSLFLKKTFPASAEMGAGAQCQNHHDRRGVRTGAGTIHRDVDPHGEFPPPLRLAQ
jgi:hypothetical protein